MYYAELDRAWADLTKPGGDLEVHEVEVGGVRVKAFKAAPSDARALWLSTAAFAERDYLVFGEDRLTYAEAHARVASLSAWLVGHGVAKGERVAIAMRNYPEWMLIYWACACIGAVAVGMNAWWTATEMAYGLKDAAPKVLFADAERIARIGEQPDMIDGVTLVAVRTTDYPDFALTWADVVAGKAALPDAEIDPDSDLCIFYTSGTTGFPKGAQLTHRSCVNNLMNIVFAGRVQARAVELATGVAPPAVPPVPPVPPVPASLICTPLFHVTANNCHAYATTAAGGKLVLMYRWDAGEALKLVERERCTVVSGVPVMARELINHPDFSQYDTSCLLTVGGGGAQLQPDLVGKIDRHVATARPNTGYGMTETSGIITSISGDFFIDKPASCGRAMPTFDTKIVDDDGHETPVGAPGELWVKGASVIKGYINRPEATAETITDGWLHTGDIARKDEHGFLFIVDRKKDLVIRGGENISCAEVEAALHRHPAVAECSVFGVPDDRLGEEVGAAVVRRPGEALTAADLKTLCAQDLAAHKIPRYIWLLDQPLPRNASGKFMKRELRSSLAVAEAA